MFSMSLRVMAPADRDVIPADAFCGKESDYKTEYWEEDEPC